MERPFGGGMIARDGWGHVLVQAMAVLVTPWTLAIAIPARAADAPEPPGK